MSILHLSTNQITSLFWTDYVLMLLTVAVVHLIPLGRWNHIENLDEFFIRISFSLCFCWYTEHLFVNYKIHPSQGCEREQKYTLCTSSLFLMFLLPISWSYLSQSINQCHSKGYKGYGCPKYQSSGSCTKHMCVVVITE